MARAPGTRHDAPHRSAGLLAVREITSALLAGRPPAELLGMVADHARHISGADLATISVPVGAGDVLEVRVAIGRRAAKIRGRRFPRAASISGRVMDGRRAELIADAALEPCAHQPVVAAGGFGPALFVPLLAGDDVFGTLLVANRSGGATFTDEDAAVVDAFAAQAALVLDTVRAEERLLAIAYRERLGRDLHDTVIQRLFAAGMRLEAARTSLTGDLDARVADAIGDLDATIREIRATIFTEPGGAAAGLGVTRPVGARASRTTGS